MAMKLCDSCKTTSAAFFCQADSAFLCATCDAQVHAANKLASRHARLRMCEPADAADLSANPLAPRHHRLPLLPFSGTCISDDEAEAASWLNKTAEDEDENDGDDLKDQSELEPLFHDDPDRVVPDNHHYAAVVDGVPVPAAAAYDVRPFMYNFATQTSSSPEIVVAEGSGDTRSSGEVYRSPVLGFDREREARVLRYREKRKKRKFEKTIRYATRKAYAETRPRIKGRFAKRSDASYGVVSSF